MASPMPSGNPRARQHGFTYLALLIAVALIGIGLAAGSEVWSQSRQREKEQELLFIGEQLRLAIALYYERTPGAVKRYPQKLQDLLEDKRYVSLQRYLRKLYADPLTGKPEWGLVPAPGGGIMGVYSKSQDRPLKMANFPEHYAAFEGARRYSQWQFIYQPAYNPAVLAPPTPTREVR
ncbi:MAG: type II secretion system protein [Betaproteobacteria bacterium]